MATAQYCNPRISEEGRPPCLHIHIHYSFRAKPELGTVAEEEHRPESNTIEIKGSSPLGRARDT